MTLERMGSRSSWEKKTVTLAPDIESVSSTAMVMQVQRNSILQRILLNILLKVLCDDCEGEILATQEDNASLKEVKVCLTLCATYFATFVRLMMQASLQTGWWREENWVLPILILASATLLLLLLFQVSFKAFIKVINVIVTFHLLIQTWNAGSAVGQINQG